MPAFLVICKRTAFDEAPCCTELASVFTGKMYSKK